jgi:response regulator RpfG family c-di-GMP phosphodiesterase
VLWISPAGATFEPAAVLEAGADEWLSAPVEAERFRIRLNSARRLHRLRETIESEQALIRRLLSTLKRSHDQLLAALVRLIELRRPGAEERGAHVARLALELARRFGIPESLHHDLVLTARLHEVGHLFSPTPADGAEDARPPGSHWALAARNVLAQVESLKGAAELAGFMYENWDGSGQPDHLQQGQIPLRSRILRVLVDFDAVTDGPPPLPPAAALDHMREHAGTRYDPMVLVHLEAVLGASPAAGSAPRRLVLPVTALRVGMVLAEDLCTDSGMKLLSRGAELTPAALETILRRHGERPILRGVAVQRRAA